MLQALLKLVLVVVIVVAAAVFFLGYRFTGDVETDKAREVGAEIGENVSTGMAEAQRAVSDGSLTAKIKSKMALDDTIQAASINVDTVRGEVTLTGTVRSEAERVRAVQLARETDGVTSVADRLVVR